MTREEKRLYARRTEALNQTRNLEAALTTSREREGELEQKLARVRELCERLINAKWDAQAGPYTQGEQHGYRSTAKVILSFLDDPVATDPEEER